MRKRRFVLFVVLALAVTALPTAVAGADPGPALTPADVTENVALGGHFDVDKTVHTPEIPPDVDVCLLEDETGSFFDDIANLQNPATILAIFNGVNAGTANPAQFAVSGFRDYPVAPFGSPGDWVYRSHSTMSPSLASWTAGVNALSAGGGNDFPEAQYDAIVASIGPGPFNDPTLGAQAACGFRYANPTVTHVLVVTTDATFHNPDGTHQNSQAATIAALNAAGGGKGVVVVGLKAPGAGGELDALAAATGGSTQALSSNGANIAQAIIDGLMDIDVEVAMQSNCSNEITTAFAPATVTVTSGDDAEFTESIWVANDAAPGTYDCEDWATVNGAVMVDDAGDRIVESKSITVVAATCVETENPHGNTKPVAPGNGGQGQNQDGFYEIGSTSGEAVFVVDDGSATTFGPFATGTEIKYTEDDDAVPSSQAMGANNGSGNNGKNQGNDTDFHIIGNGDALVVYIDGFGNVTVTACLVPPPPK